MSILNIVIAIILVCVVLIALIKFRLIYSVAWLAVSFLIAEHKEWALHSFLFSSWHVWVWLALGIATFIAAIILDVKDIKKRKAKKNKNNLYEPPQNFEQEQKKNNFQPHDDVKQRYDFDKKWSADTKENRELLQEGNVETGKTLHQQSNATVDHQENAEPNAVDDNEKKNSGFHYCDDHLKKFKKKWDYFDSEIERKIFPILKTFINNEYLIIPHAAPREILSWKWDDNWPLTNKVNSMHFDFVIFEQLFTDNMSVMLFPVLFIEVNGSDHEKKADVIEKDEFKQKLLEQLGYKLVTIDATKTIPDDSLEQVVIQCIKEAVPSREDYAIHCPKCKEKMQIKKNHKNQEYFYGCIKWRSDKTGCTGGRNISDVPPLYDGIPTKLE